MIGKKELILFSVMIVTIFLIFGFSGYSDFVDEKTSPNSDVINFTEDVEGLSIANSDGPYHVSLSYPDGDGLDVYYDGDKSVCEI